MRRLLHLTILCLFTTVSAFAQDRFWVGPANGNWSNANNWSLTAGGPGGASVPGEIPGGVGLNAIFDGTRRTNAIIDIPVNVGLFHMRPGYSATITQNAAVTATAGMTINNGTFAGGSNIDVQGIFRQTGGSINTGPQNLSISGNFIHTGGSFITGPGTVTFTSNLSIGNPANIVSTSGTVVIGGATPTTLNVGSSTFNRAVSFNNVTINKPGSSFSITTGDTLASSGTLTLVDGNIASNNSILRADENLDVQATFDGALGGDIIFGGAANGTANFSVPYSSTIYSEVKVIKTNPSATVSFVTNLPSNIITVLTNSNATFNVISGIVNFPDNDQVDFNFAGMTIGSQGTFTASGGTTNLTGNFSNNGVFNGNDGTFVFAGTGNQLFNSGGVGVNRSTRFSNLTINNTGTPGYLLIDNGDTLIANNSALLTDGALGVTGTTGGYFQIDGNLSVATSFSATSQYVGLILGGGNPQSLTFAAGTQGHFNGPINLFKSGNATVTLNSPWLIDYPNQNMTFTSGNIITTNTNLLSFVSTATATIIVGYVDGPVQKTGITPFTFPTGNGGFPAPIRMTGNGTFNGSFTGSNKTFRAQYFHTSPGPLYPRDQIQPPVDPSLKVSQQEYWRVGQVGGVAIAERPFLWLSYENVRSGGLTDIDAVGVAAWLGSDVWSQFGNGGTATAGGFSYLRSGSRNLTTNEIDPVFTFITDDSIANPLPVTWLGFTGRYYNAVVELNWSTSLELNNATFTVERSGDGDKYQSIGTIPGRGTVNSTSYYSFIDKEPVPGVNHYRIKQTDIDGKFSYSKEIRVSTAELGQNGLRLFPNPMTASLPLVLENADWKNQKVTVTIYNATGGIVQQQQVTFGADSRSRLDLSRLKKGSYFITTTLADGKKQTLSFIVQ